MADETPDNKPVTAESADPAAANEATAAESAAAESPDKAPEPAAPADQAVEDSVVPPPAQAKAESAPDAAPPVPSRFGTLGVPLAAVLALLLVVAATCATFFGIRYFDEKNVADARSGGSQFACSFAKSLVTYDFNNLDQFFRNVLDQTTGALQSDFQGTKAQDLKQRVIASQSKSTPNDANCGLVSGDQHKAVVVVTLTQNVTSTGTQGQTVVMPPAVMIITATNSDGHWKASDLQPIGLQQ